MPSLNRSPGGRPPMGSGAQRPTKCAPPRWASLLAAHLGSDDRRRIVPRHLVASAYPAAEPSAVPRRLPRRTRQADRRGASAPPADGWRRHALAEFAQSDDVRSRRVAGATAIAIEWPFGCRPGCLLVIVQPEIVDSRRLRSQPRPSPDPAHSPRTAGLLSLSKPGRKRPLCAGRKCSPRGGAPVEI